MRANTRPSGATEKESASLLGSFAQDIVVVEHDAPPVLLTVDVVQTASGRRDWVVHLSDQDVGQHRACEMAPQPLDQVQARA
jgi:hypothetical protein